MARDGWMFVGPSLGVIASGLVLNGLDPSAFGWTVIVVGILFTLAFAFFFRDPSRTPPKDPNAVVATADGRIIVVASRPDGGTQIDTFLSVLDVHVNRAPVTGVVTGSTHRPGQFRVAWKDEAGTGNERHDLVIESSLGTIRSAQIAGILARRIICRPKYGDRVQVGERIGIIRFGSRAEVVIPYGFKSTVKVGDHVRAGESVIARRVVS